jgi:hypothetical protein
MYTGRTRSDKPMSLLDHSRGHTQPAIAKPMQKRVSKAKACAGFDQTHLARVPLAWR